MATQPAEIHPTPEEKKKLVRRMAPDRSQRIPQIVHLSFVALNAWLGLQYLNREAES